uniref:Uncharacterized protein n=1 Tax=Timema monikensis TaxID=170555 RepID=A0A7R9E8B8_9NEOP|nr:unnamed protein product [Timema monikensis]
MKALPQDDPTIEGIASTYSIGDYVMGNCTSAKSNPPSILAWYINDVKVIRCHLLQGVAVILAWYINNIMVIHCHLLQGVAVILACYINNVKRRILICGEEVIQTPQPSRSSLRSLEYLWQKCVSNEC